MKTIRTFSELEKKLSRTEQRIAAIAAAEDENVIRGIKLAREMGFIRSAIVTGDANRIRSIINLLGEDVSHYDIKPAASSIQAALMAVKAVKHGDAQILVKGNLETTFYLRAILDKENGIAASKLLSNITLFEMESYHKFIAVTDNAINPLPNLIQKKFIIENTGPLYIALGIPEPKVAVLSAVETINPNIPSTLDAACLAKMSERGQINGFKLDGPLSYDVAMDLKCAQAKSLKNYDVAGDPDILLAPNIEAANILGKAYKFHGQAKSGGLVLGATAPIVLNSRSDGPVRRLNSILLACAIASEYETNN